jgi:hypothetical protein
MQWCEKQRQHVARGHGYGKERFCPKTPNYRLFREVLDTPQSATITIDQYVTMQRD